MTFDTILTHEIHRRVHQGGLLAEPHHHRLPRRGRRPHPGQDRGDRPPPAGHLPRAAGRNRPLRTGFARTGRPARRRRVVPAAELDRVPGPALRGHPDRRGQQPADPDLPGPRGRLHGRVRRIQGPGRPAGVPQVRLPGDGRTGSGRAGRPCSTCSWSTANPATRTRPGNRSWPPRGSNAATRPNSPRLRPDPNEVTLLMFTSGTTGEPKGVMHTHNTLVAANAAAARAARRRAATASSTWRPPFAHLTGLLYGVRLQTQLGRHRRLPGRLEQRAVRRTDRAAQDHLHLGGDPVPARHPERAEHRRARRVLAGPVLLLGRARSRRPSSGRPGSGGPSWPCSAAGGRPRTPWSPSASPATPRRRSSTATATRWPGMRIRVVDEDGTVLPAGHRRPVAGDRAVPVRRVRQAAGDDPGAVRRRAGSTPATSRASTPTGT